MYLSPFGSSYHDCNNYRGLSLGSSPEWTTVTESAAFDDVLNKLKAARQTGATATLHSEEFRVRVDRLYNYLGGRRGGDFNRLEAAARIGAVNSDSEEFRALVDSMKKNLGGQEKESEEFRGRITVHLNVPEGDVGIFLDQMGSAGESGKFIFSVTFTLAKTAYVMKTDPTSRRNYGFDESFGHKRAIPAEDLKAALCQEGRLNIEARISIRKEMKAIASTRKSAEKPGCALAQTLDSKEVYGERKNPCT